MASSCEKIGQVFQDNIHHDAFDILYVDRRKE